MLVNGGEVLQGIRFLSTPGHSIDHAAISISSRGMEAIFGGDVMHHPFELYEPDLVSVFCEFPEGARSSRRWLADLIGKGIRYTSVVIFRSLRLGVSPKQVKTSPGSLWMPEVNGSRS